MIPLIFATMLSTTPIEIALDGRLDATTAREGVTIELKREDDGPQRLTIRGKFEQPLVIHLYPRLVPSKVMFKAHAVRRVIGDWIDAPDPLWRTDGDVLHLDIRVPAGLSGSAPTFALIGRSNADDVARAAGLIRFVARVRDWMNGVGDRRLSTEAARDLGSLAMRHAVKIDGEEASSAVFQDLAVDIRRFCGADAMKGSSPSTRIRIAMELLGAIGHVPLPR